MSQNLKNTYKHIEQYYRMDNTTNQNQPYGIVEFYTTGPQGYCLQPNTCHGFHRPFRHDYNNYLNTIFQNNLSNKPNKYGQYN